MVDKVWVGTTEGTQSITGQPTGYIPIIKYTIFIIVIFWSDRKIDLFWDQRSWKSFDRI